MKTAARTGDRPGNPINFTHSEPTTQVHRQVALPLHDIQQMDTPSGIRRPPLREAMIFDVDGTLCDVRSIRHHVSPPPGSTSFKADFDAFHGASIDCPPHEAVLELLLRAHGAGLAILVVTGRAEKWSFVTTMWLGEHGIPFDELMMRPRGDSRPAD
ncbi:MULTISPECIES: hypothetical protein [Arthrobacter]|uniref:Polynucleotide kinase PNKP phosphatase domain-containing protein n=2 Tax=Arthrobacter TaxID=1663 RepID=A0ABU9KNW6_9MICC|nr:hypothetical protein [Arthrobacter sp. YJM1]MDP5228517.1 hypothetical protein [Arthrobacter sp. YJM1]